MKYTYIYFVSLNEINIHSKILNILYRFVCVMRFISKLTILHVSAWFQKLAPSSKLNSTPPTGAPKAAETPAAAPPETKSLFSVSLRKYSNS